jgi:rubrerythrin
MVLIQKLEEAIEDEIHDVKHYAKWATELKKEYPSLAQVLYTISTQEDGHQAMIHAEVVKIVEAYRKTNGEPPAAMMAVYNYLHKRSIDKLAEAKRYQEVYKNA